jgi:hypothetical protein
MTAPAPTEPTPNQPTEPARTNVPASNEGIAPMPVMW